MITGARIWGVLTVVAAVACSREPLPIPASPASEPELLGAALPAEEVEPPATMPDPRDLPCPSNVSCLGACCPYGFQSAAYCDWRATPPRCALRCFTGGFVDCDGEPTNGCEIQTSTDPENCGGCGRECPPGLQCDGGRCL